MTDKTLLEKSKIDYCPKCNRKLIDDNYCFGCDKKW